MRYCLKICIVVLLFLFQYKLGYTQTHNELYNKAASAYQKGNYKSAYNTFLQLEELILRENGRESMRYITNKNNLALLEKRNGQLDKALASYEEASALAVKLRSFEQWKKIQSNIAVLYLQKSQYRKALKILTSLYDNIKPELRLKETGLLLNLGDTYSSMGEYNKAEEFALMAIQSIQKYGDEDNLHDTALNNLAGVYHNLGQYENAEDYYRQALRKRDQRVGKGHPDYAHVLSNLANLLYLQDRLVEAEKLARQSVDIYAGTVGASSTAYQNAVDVLAQILIAGKTEVSKSFLEKQVKSTSKDFGEISLQHFNALSTLGLYYADNGNYKKSIEAYEQALNVSSKLFGENHVRQATLLNNISQVYNSQKKYDIALQYSRKALNITLEFVKNQLPYLPETSRIMLIDQFRPILLNFYDNSLMAKVDESEVAQSLVDIQLKFKGILFRSGNRIRNQILSSGDTALIAKFYEWKESRLELARLYQENLSDRNSSLQSLIETVEKLERELSIESTLFSKSQDLQEADWKTIQNSLERDEAFIDIARLPRASGQIDYLAAIVKGIPNSKPELVVFANGSDLEGSHLENYKRSILLKIKNEESYGIYWTSFAEKLGGFKRVYLSPEGAYSEVNVNTLLNPDSRQFLIDELEIHLVANGSEVISQEEILDLDYSEFRDITLFGSPQFDKKGVTETNNALILTPNLEYSQIKSSQRFFDSRGRISQLPGTEIEVDEIEKLATENGLSVTKYKFQNASEETFLITKTTRYLHIATHGYFLDQLIGDNTQSQLKVMSHGNPMLKSGLLFAGAQLGIQGKTERNNDGFVTALDVQNMNLSGTELVVISACESGLGESKGGEGVFGLTRAFREAGANSVLFSLWKVDDIATKELMIEFYNNIFSEGMNTREAFIEAQQTIRLTYPDPYYWGAFMISGS